jgi:hypothetical protein
MDDCTKYFDRMADLRLGSLDDDDQAGLFAHLAECSDCREMMRFHDDLAGAANEFSEAGAEALAGVRGRVLDEIRGEAALQGRVANRSMAWTMQRSRALAAAAAVVLAIGGFAVGRMAAGPAGADGGQLVVGLESSALNHHRLRDVEDSPDIISNVSVRRAGDGLVAMSFDVSRHLEVVRSIDDPLVNEVLVHAILDQSSLGSRLKAVSMAAGARNDKVEEALIFSMLEDPELPVRMRALEILSERPASEMVSGGLMQVLRHDDSMQMRLLAIEVLAEGSPDGRQVLEDFIQTDESVEPAIAERLASYIRS